MTLSLGQTFGGARSLTLLLVLAVLAVAGFSARLWGVDTPPLIDLPNHFARHILQCGALGSEAIARYYVYGFEIVPNLAAELVYQTPLACIDPALTQKVLIQISSLGLFLATMVLHRAMWGAWSLWPLLSGLVMHHMAWAYGFENFALAAPFALLVLAVWFSLEKAGPVARLCAVWPLAVGLYVLHLYAFGFLMMAIGLLELQGVLDRRRAGGALKAAAVSLALLALIALGPALHLHFALAASPEVQTGTVTFGNGRTLMMTLLSPVAGFGHVLDSPETLWVAAAALAVLLIAPLVCARIGMPIRFDRRLRLAAPVMLGITLLVPYEFAGVYFTNIRFPVLLTAVLIAATRVEFGARSGGVFAVLVLAVIGARTEWIAGKWQQHDAQVAELREAARLLTAQDRLIVLREGNGHLVKAHSHSAAYILRDRGTYWEGLFTGGNALAPRPEFAARDHIQPFPWLWQMLKPEYQDYPLFAEGSHLHNWQDFLTHALVILEPETAAPDMSEIGVPIAQGTYFKILSLNASTVGGEQQPQPQTQPTGLD